MSNPNPGIYKDPLTASNNDDEEEEEEEEEEELEEREIIISKADIDFDDSLVERLSKIAKEVKIKNENTISIELTSGKTMLVNKRYTDNGIEMTFSAANLEETANIIVNMYENPKEVTLYAEPKKLANALKELGFNIVTNENDLFYEPTKYEPTEEEAIEDTIRFM